MFGRGKDEKVARTQTQGAPQAGPDKSGVLTEEQHDELVVQLRKTGQRAKATVTTETFGGNFGEDGCVWRTALNVRPAAGDPFDAEIALLMIAFDEDFPPWKVGDVTTVAFDRDDHYRVAFLPPSEAPTILWRVPAVCPHCGAPVDQATESMADQPTCHFCHQPLPSEPGI